MQKMMQTLIFAVLALPVWTAVARAQSAVAVTQAPEAFASENAILDTAIPFAIGAREARQALRGSFGWPSFQEGLVEGVYFRFDPDGYARFAPTPRLDVDVFEVICRPRTLACAARKDGLEVFLTDRGQLQMKLESALAGDQFFVSEGVSEIQIPERILQPLDVPLELLLGSGGELIIRRGGTEVARISFKGFPAVTAYLRWIAARQDYAVLPRGWPVPNADAGLPRSNMTQPTAWNSPMPQPQVLMPGYVTPVPSGIAPATSAAPLTLAQTPAPSAPVPPQPNLGQVAQYPSPSVGEDARAVEAVRTEILHLKELILQAQQQPVRQVSTSEMAVVGDAPNMAALLAAIEDVQGQVAQLQAQVIDPVEAASGAVASAPITAAASFDQYAPGAGHAVPLSDAMKLEILVKALGLDAETATSVLKLTRAGSQRGDELQRGETSTNATTHNGLETMTAKTTNVLFENALVDEILAELEAEIAADVPDPAPQPAAPLDVAEPVADYQLLSRYFASAALPALQDFAAQAQSQARGASN